MINPPTFGDFGLGFFHQSIMHMEVISLRSLKDLSLACITFVSICTILPKYLMFILLGSADLPD